MERDVGDMGAREGLQPMYCASRVDVLEDIYWINGELRLGEEVVLWRNRYRGRTRSWYFVAWGGVGMGDRIKGKKSLGSERHRRHGRRA